MRRGGLGIAAVAALAGRVAGRGCDDLDREQLRLERAGEGRGPLHRKRGSGAAVGGDGDHFRRWRHRRAQRMTTAASGLATLKLNDSSR